MNEVLPAADRPNRAKAAAMVARFNSAPIQAAQEILAPEPAKAGIAAAGTSIAETTAAAVREAITNIAPGASFKAELEIQHQDERGAKTMAKLNLMHWGAR